MDTAHDFDNIFDTRDIDGNEPDEPELSDGETNEIFLQDTPEDLDDNISDDELDEDTDAQAPTSSQLSSKVRHILDEMDRTNLKLADFLNGLSWGDQACTQDAKIRTEQTILLHSQQLHSILQRWAVPPRMSRSKKRRAEGASPIVNAFSIDYVRNTMHKELSDAAKPLSSPASMDVRVETLTETSFEGMANTLQDTAPLLFNLLYSLTGQTAGGPKKTEMIVVMIIAMISYTRSHHRNRLQKLLSLYFKFKGLSAKGFDSLHAMALTMSHKWTSNAVERISEQCMEEVRALMKLYPWTISYDNVNIPFRVFSQRLDNQGEHGNGTAGTIYMKPKARPLSIAANADLKNMRAAGMKTPLSSLDIMDLAQTSYPRVEKFMVYRVLQCLLDSPDFNRKTYFGRNNPLLQPPPPLKPLPTGPDHAALQFLLGTVNIAEASYEDNARLINEWFNQLGIMDPEQRKQFSTSNLAFWIGDQLTVERLRGIFKFRAEDENSFERLDFSVFIFGWFHLQMAFANSLHKQYLGTSKSRGLKQAFQLLEKKGLTKPQTKGPFFHDLDEALHEVAEAHFREDWRVLGRVNSLADLRSSSPEELLKLAEMIVRRRASSDAINSMDSKSPSHQDDQLRNLTLWNRDVLQYIVLDDAIQNGDVGLMEDMLPHLFFRFVGGGNNKYAGEIMETLQGLHREWPAEVKEFVREHCWLVNTTGKPGMFCGVDKAQEHNIKEIKVTYRSEGPNIKWEYLKKLHPAIRTIRIVAVHVEKAFGTLSRGAKHTKPSREKDIVKLQRSYQASGYHNYKAGRKVKRKMLIPDYATVGATKVITGKVIQCWKDLRSFERATTEVWDDLLDDTT
ncbi:hypothetical protein NLJ89_g10340 [Agrocybe chaxingu]|uniref:DUF6589 domain-containing protein n=1 Tax=Agrocybe chaxingu TaxID=84603 RepID=A0A9W8JP20_9AGAR|nr:hypothetical protein NLJ89_g10340 [Agrocybe chaxingu]